MAVIEGADNVFYFVSDMKRAVAFYRDVLGLTLVSEGERWSLFDLGGIRLGLHTTAGKPLLQNAVGERGVIAGAQVTLRVTDVHAACATLRARGVEFVSGVIAQPGGEIAKFRDPDGNRLNIRGGKNTW